MEFSEVLRRRRMVRAYDPARPVAADVVDQLIAAGLRAPSAGASQGWHFLVLTSAEDRRLYWDATSADGAPDAWLRGMQTAPVLVLAFSDRSAYERRYRRADKARGIHAPIELDQRWPVPYWHVDVGMAGALILLAAVDAGLGACWFGVPVDRVAEVGTAFGIPDGLVPVGAITIGYPARPGPGSAAVRAVAEHPTWSELVSYGRFGSGGGRRRS